MKKCIKITCVAALGISLQGCALLPKTLKAPCGPTAGLTDACGNRVPLNKQHRPEFGGFTTRDIFEVTTPRKPSGIEV